MTKRMAVMCTSAIVLAAGCAPSADLPGVPLYPSSGPALPRAEVARLYGPIASVDGRSVDGMGDAYEVLPGCHSVVSRGEALDSTNYVAVVGVPRGKAFVLPMQAGFAYRVRQVTEGETTTVAVIHVRTFAEELDPSGASTGIIQPATGDALAACKEHWEGRGH
jgi:hypothetical protein